MWWQEFFGEKERTKVHGVKHVRGLCQDNIELRLLERVKLLLLHCQFQDFRKPFLKFLDKI